MKSIILLLFSFFFISFKPDQDSQFNIRDFVKMASFNSNEFETYILNRGFDYDKTKSFGSFYVVYYKKLNRSIGKSISEDFMKTVLYETSSKEEYLYLKNQVQELGYKYIGNKIVNKGETTVFQTYKRGNVKIDFYTADRKTFLGYCIGFDIQ